MEYCRDGVMKRITILAMTFLMMGCGRRIDPDRGTLLIVGGRGKPPEAVEAFIGLCEGGPILVIPSASGVPQESGPEAVKMFEDAGAEDVDWLFIANKDMADADSVVARVERARGIFFTGGSQSRLMERVGGTRFAEAMKRLYFEKRGVVGGTSAGAAVQSERMITGEGDFSILEKENIVTEPGFGFLTNCIIDQHFVARQRNNRLLSLVIETGLSGIGIDESTAILYYPNDTFGVYGEGSVLVYDTKDMIIPDAQHARLAAENVRLHVLKDGQTFDMVKGRVVR